MKILILPGDGIGREVCEVCTPVFDILNLDVQIEYGEIGWDCWLKYGDPIPKSTWERIATCDAILLGATTSKGKKEAEAELPKHIKNVNEYVSPIIQLRKRLDLFVNIRPCELMYGNFRPFNLTIIRENTEGLYSGIDRRGIPKELDTIINHNNLNKSGIDNATFSIRLQTKFGLERLFKYAFNYALKNNCKKITLADKPNVLRESGQFAKDIFYNIASNYKGIIAEIQNVDALALNLVRNPERYNVIVAENMFGDILSDLVAGLMGGLGFAPSANIGNGIPYFEPVHGSSPKHAGKNKVNPCAMFLTISLLLEYFNYKNEAFIIKKAIKSVIKNGIYATYDMGGHTTTTDMAKAILSEIAFPTINSKIVKIICVGNELLNGSTINSNATNFSKILNANNYKVRLHSVVQDKEQDIIASINNCLNSDLIIISGGLGPTLDDITRKSVAKALDLPLIYSYEAKKNIEEKLSKLGIEIDELSKRQAFIPKGAELIQNNVGVAEGFRLYYNLVEIIALPGPPNECISMMNQLFNNKIKNNNYIKWRLLGINESELSFIVENFFSKYNDITVVKGIYWRYPYVDLELEFINAPTLVILQQLSALLKKFIIIKQGKSALDLLKEYLENKSNISLFIKEGAISEALREVFKNYLIDYKKDNNIIINISTESNVTFEPPYTGSIVFICKINDKSFSTIIPKSRKEIINYAIEYVSFCILKNLGLYNE